MELMHLMRQLKMEYLIANLDALCEQAAKDTLIYSQIDGPNSSLTCDN